MNNIYNIYFFKCSIETLLAVTSNKESVKVWLCVFFFAVFFFKPAEPQEKVRLLQYTQNL